MTEPNWQALNQFMNGADLPDPQEGQFVFDVNETMVSVNDKTMTLAQYVRMVARNQITQMLDSVYLEAKLGQTLPARNGSEMSERSDT